MILSVDAGNQKKKYAPEWVPVAEAEQALNNNDKPVLISLYTDWCGWCKLMDRNTWGSKEVSEYVTANFAAVKFNAESNGTVQWNNTVFNLRQGERTHEFALFLTNGRLSYPSLVIIPAKGMAPEVIPGYLKPSEIEAVLKYFGEGAWKKQDFLSYHRKFKGRWK